MQEANSKRVDINPRTSSAERALSADHGRTHTRVNEVCMRCR
jgi:hypothetical protein